MRVAFFSPLPPAKSGIADYSAALLEHWNGPMEVETFAAKPAAFDASRYDVCVYQLGNNPYHGFVYEAALKHPGVVVMHEANLHHLIADLTIIATIGTAMCGRSGATTGRKRRSTPSATCERGSGLRITAWR